MSTTAWIITIVVIVIVIIVIVVGVMMSTRRRRENAHREQAAELRDKAQAVALDAKQHEVDAAQAEAAARQSEIDAARLRDEAAQRRAASEEAQAEAARQAEHADKLDPDVNTRARRRADEVPVTAVDPDATAGGTGTERPRVDGDDLRAPGGDRV